MTQGVEIVFSKVVYVTQLVDFPPILTLDCHRRFVVHLFFSFLVFIFVVEQAVSEMDQSWQWKCNQFEPGVRLGNLPASALLI